MYALESSLQNGYTLHEQLIRKSNISKIPTDARIPFTEY